MIVLYLISTAIQGESVNLNHSFCIASVLHRTISKEINSFIHFDSKQNKTASSKHENILTNSLKITKKSEWKDFFEGSDYQKITRGGDFGNGQYYAHKCVFYADKSSSIVLNNVDNKLLVESCFFSGYEKQGEGAAIYFFKAGQCCINRVSGRYCSVKDNSNHGHFSHIHVSDEENSKNFMIFSTIVSCGSEDQGQNTCYFLYGNQNISNVNISQCKSEYSSSAEFYTSKQYQNKFSSFENCTTKLIYVVNFNNISKHSNNDNIISNCNVINNNGAYIINALTRSSLKFEDCIFQGNQKGPLFQKDRTSDITLSNCWISPDNTASPIGIDTNQFTMATKFILKNEYFNAAFPPVPSEAMFIEKFSKFLQQHGVSDYRRVWGR